MFLRIWQCFSLSVLMLLFFLCRQRKKQRELLAIGTHAMLPGAHAEENGLPMPLHQQAVFLTHASPPSHNTADSEFLISRFVGLHRNRWVRARGRIQSKGFNFGAWTQRWNILTIFLHRNWWHVRLGLNTRVTISRDFFGYFLSRKESNTVKLRH
jgi:hypothetical protein